MKAHRIAAGVVGATLSLTLAACGSSATTPPTSGSQPAAKTSPKSAAFEPLTLAAFKTSLPRAVTGIKTVHIAMTSDIATVQGDTSYGPPLSMSLTGYGTAQGQTVNFVERLVGTDLYIQSPGHTPPGKFLRIDLATLPQTAGLFNLIHEMQTSGPAAMAAQFKAATESLKYDGMETIAGQQAQHYTVVVNAVAAAKLISADAAAMASAEKIGKVTEEVYLSGDHRPIRIVMPMPAPVGTMQIDFSKYGEPVHVTAPPASQILTPSQLATSSGATTS